MNNRKQSTIKSVDSQEDYEQAITSSNGSIVMVNAWWCPVCKGALGEFNKLSMKHVDIAFFTIDPSEHFDLVNKTMQVTSFPSFLLYKEGVCVRQITGADIGELTKSLNDLQWGQT